MKKVLFIALAAAMLFTLLPATALAADGTVNTKEELTTALATDGNITLGADIDAGDIVSGSFFTVGKDITVTLDLNGHTLQGTRTGIINTELINNCGTLTIKDGKGGGQLIIDSTTDSGWDSYCAVICNLSTLNVQSGTLLNNGGTAMSFAVDNNSNIGNAELNVSGGLIKSANYIAIRQFTNSTTSTNIVNITGGSVYGDKRGIWIQQPFTGNGLGTLNISGGTVEATLQAAVLADLMGTDGVDINITGGILINHSNTHATVSLDYGTGAVVTAGGAYVNVHGGQFSNTGTAGNLANYITNVTHPSVIEVYKGKFSALVPSHYIAAGANLVDIVIGDDTDVTAGVEASYIIVIPALVDFGSLIKGNGPIDKEFDVIARDVVIGDGASIKVSVTSLFEMKDKDGSGSATLAYTLTSESGSVTSGQEFASFNAGRTEDGTISVDTDKIVNAGSYKGTMVFTVSYQ